MQIEPGRDATRLVKVNQRRSNWNCKPSWNNTNSAWVYVGICVSMSHGEQSVLHRRNLAPPRCISRCLAWACNAEDQRGTFVFVHTWMKHVCDNSVISLWRTTGHAHTHTHTHTLSLSLSLFLSLSLISSGVNDRDRSASTAPLEGGSNQLCMHEAKSITEPVMTMMESLTGHFIPTLWRREAPKFDSREFNFFFFFGFVCL